VRPVTGWLASSGLDLTGVSWVDGSLRTARPEIVAVGTARAWWSARYGRGCGGALDIALNAPEVAAAALLGQDAVSTRWPYFWSSSSAGWSSDAAHHRWPPR